MPNQAGLTTRGFLLETRPGEYLIATRNGWGPSHVSGPLEHATVFESEWAMEQAERSWSDKRLTRVPVQMEVVKKI